MVAKPPTCKLRLTLPAYLVVHGVARELIRYELRRPSFHHRRILADRFDSTAWAKLLPFHFSGYGQLSDRGPQTLGLRLLGGFPVHDLLPVVSAVGFPTASTAFHKPLRGSTVRELPALSA